MAAVFKAVLLAASSSMAAFLSNVSFGTEAILRFGVGVAVALAWSYVILGKVAPQMLVGIEQFVGPDSVKGAPRIFYGLALSFVAVVGGPAVALAAVITAVGIAALAEEIGERRPVNGRGPAVRDARQRITRLVSGSPEWDDPARGCDVRESTDGRDFVFRVAARFERSEESPEESRLFRGEYVAEGLGSKPSTPRQHLVDRRSTSIVDCSQTVGSLHQGLH